MKNSKENKVFLSVSEAAKILGVSRIAVFNKIKKGQIVAQKIGRAYAISKDDLHSFMGASKDTPLTEVEKREIEEAVGKVVSEYGETLRLLGKE